MERKLSKTKLQKFKMTFENKRQEIIKAIKNLDVELDFDGDEVDAVQGFVLSDLVDKFSKRDIDKLNKLEAALKRIDSGTFGVCENCEALISEKRLLALPACMTCISCAEQEEIEAKHMLRGS